MGFTRLWIFCWNISSDWRVNVMEGREFNEMGGMLLIEP